VVFAALFIASSRVFAFYASRFGSFGPTYGSLAGGVVLLLWSWLSAAAFIVGGEVSAALPGARPRRSPQNQ
jgi:membrane protein